MKRVNFLVSLALCLLATACQQDEWMSQQDNRNFVSVNATMEEPSSRSTVGATTGNFSWAAGDEIGVWTSGTPSFQALKYNNENQKFEGTLVGDDLKFSQYAVYPHSINHSIPEGTLSVYLPDEYKHTEDPYVANTNALMVANIGEATSTLSNLNFYHAGGVLSVKVKNLPKNTCGVKLTTNRVITGSFNVTEPNTKTPTITTTAVDASSNNTITITFPKLGSVETNAMQFFFPLPKGTGYTFKLEYLLEGVTEPIIIKEGTTPNNIERAQLLMMPTLTLVSTGAIPESSGYEVVTIGDKTTYVVYNAAGLQAVNQLVLNDYDANITLADNIDLTSAPSLDANGSNWKPINSSYTNNYIGTFDGNGKSIKGIIIKNTPKDETNYKNTTNYTYDALIRFLGKSGQVKNLILEDCTINGNSKVGSIVGYNMGGTVTECKLIGTTNITGLTNVGGFIGEFTSGTISNCSIEGFVTIKGVDYVGGIVGVSGKSTNIVNCDVIYNSDTPNAIIATGVNAGGIAGSCGFSASDCDVENKGSGTATINGQYAGGFAGAVSNTGIVINCSVSGCIIEGSDDVGKGNVGGFSGVNHGMSIACKVQSTSATGLTMVGGFTGQNNGTLMACYVNAVTANMTTTSTTEPNSVGGIVGLNAASNPIPSSVISCYAYQCTVQHNGEELTNTDIATSETLVTANIVGSNGFNYAGSATANHGYHNGTITQCYYYGKNSSDGRVYSVYTVDSGNDKECDAAGNKIDEYTVSGDEIKVNWGNASTSETAVYLMNDVIKRSSVTSKYLWGGAYNVPTLTK